MSKEWDVIIVGAGPSGLMMGALFSRLGIHYRIIDKKRDPTPTSNAIVIQTRTLELLDDLHLLNLALTEGNVINSLRINDFTKTIASLDIHLPKTPHSYILGLSQHETEIILAHVIQTAGVTIERGITLTQITNRGDHTELTLQTADNQNEVVKAKWVIACDGGHSIIRESMHIPFRGKELPQHFLMADIETDAKIVEHHLQAFLDKEGPLLLIRYNKNCLRVILEVSNHPDLKEAKSLDLATLENLLKIHAPFPIPIRQLIWSSGFWIHERLSDQYRVDNIFFVGDAAHLHSPAGGQGMNTGMQDANNLAWKLAFVIQHKAKKNMLDTYQAERLPFAKSLLKRTTFFTHFVTLKNPLLIRCRNFVLSRLLKIHAFRQKMLETLTQLNIHYHDNALVQSFLAQHGAAKAGTRFLDIRLKNDFLLDHMRGPHFYLLIFSGKKQLDIHELNAFDQFINESYPQFVTFILITHLIIQDNTWDGKIINDADFSVHRLYGVKTSCLYLIRPDKYIGLTASLSDKNKLFDYLYANFNPN